MLSLLFISSCIQWRRVCPAFCSTPGWGFWLKTSVKWFFVSAGSSSLSVYGRRHSQSIDPQDTVLDKIANFWLHRIPTDWDANQRWENLGLQMKSLGFTVRSVWTKSQASAPLPTTYRPCPGYVISLGLKIITCARGMLNTQEVWCFCGYCKDAAR